MDTTRPLTRWVAQRSEEHGKAEACFYIFVVLFDTRRCEDKSRRHICILFLSQRFRRRRYDIAMRVDLTPSHQNTDLQMKKRLIAKQFSIVTLNELEPSPITRLFPRPTPHISRRYKCVQPFVLRDIHTCITNRTVSSCTAHAPSRWQRAAGSGQQTDNRQLGIWACVVSAPSSTRSAPRPSSSLELAFAVSGRGVARRIAHRREMPGPPSRTCVALSTSHSYHPSSLSPL